MPQIKDYYNTAQVLSSVMDQSLSEYFEECVRNTGGFAIQSQFADWKVEASKCEQYDTSLSFVNYIWFILSSENSRLASTPRQKYYEKRRQAKKYWTRLVQAERKDSYKTGMLRTDCTRYFDSYRSNSGDMKAYSSEEEYLENRYRVVMEWSKDLSQNLIAFPESQHLKESKLADYFFLDCAFKAFDYIETNLHDDVMNGYYVLVPKLVNQGLFSWSSFSKEMDARVLNGSIEVIDDVDGHFQTVVDKIEGDFSEAVLNGTENELVTSLVKSGKLSLTNNVLNAMDQGILVTVYSLLSVEDLNHGSKTISLLDIVKAVSGGKPRRDSYINVIESLMKLAKCKVELKETNKHGRVVSGGIISFFDLAFKTGESSDENTSVDVSIIDGSPQQGMDIIEYMSGIKDLSQLTVEIMPSQYIKKELRSEMSARNIKILTSMYEKEMLSNREKKMLAFLTEERTSIYPQTYCSIALDTFKKKMRIVEKKKRRVLEQISSSIGYLKEHNIVVKEFTVNEYSVDITFIPISKLEREMYNLTDDEVAVITG